MQPTSLSLSLHLCHRRRLLPPHLVFPTQTEHRGELPSTAVVVGRRTELNPSREVKPTRATNPNHASRNRGLTLKFTVPRQVDPLRVDSIGGHNQVSGKGFPTTGPRIEAGNVVIHRGLHVTRPLVVACVSSGVRSCLWIGPDAGCSVKYSYVNGLRCALEITRLICASLEITRLIGVSFGITRLIRASFGIMRLICAFYGTTRLLCKGPGRGRPTRGKKDGLI
ncbi:hypothetical protein E6C27_scaffold3085G00120 [Cucumis melo var. makuwa]|uniref:Ty3-gypsy retrotransposon protein n=1 Tax=Cucumis melo var. makuwa TaxID=1194695 RepID=A0A5A7T873_CUCMM|nr:hypothetical protein E6C27_scaffold3085G00120 [Cucumis melo var. makuwa]